jgi:hypothetical protein
MEPSVKRYDDKPSGEAAEYDLQNLGTIVKSECDSIAGLEASLPQLATQRQCTPV